ncbi:class I SAM-dependent methyltransferase [Denitromonas iodatirespirans]|uniref:Class I SAM-dependent methyltransferase n=1 Tax=Denitromonas iodatirespirans TaxID=2795389 RepID=A0A944DCB4_DENI1|nr:class I SAM-dependent methyltransferase [Denitromonas iodatirespirans]MBT0962832.1 class I SAM-dependent methyltransferase [Denitromonas iodatirespirans]
MSESARFWDWIADRYAKQPVPDAAAYQHKLDVTRQYFTPDMQVLEFGCGTGTTAISHAPHVAQIRAIDVSPKMLDIARQKAAAAGVSNVRFEQSSIDALAAADASFDVVMGHSILHLLRDKDAAIAKVHRLLKPGGVFITSTTCAGDSPKLRAIGFVLSIGSRLGLLPYLSVFTEKDLHASLTRAGFDIAHRWQPKPNSAVFIVAKKPADP